MPSLDSEYGWLVIMGVCLIVGGILLFVTAWAFTNEYERGGRDSVHRRPRKPEPWHREPSGEYAAVPDTKVPARHRLDTVGERTTNLSAYTRHMSAARAMLPVPITRQGERVILDGDHAGTSGRVRQVEEVDEQEEGGADRERRQDEGRPVEDGEEGSGDAKAARPVGDGTRMWRNTVTGEIVMTDPYGRRIEWSNGE